MLRKAECLACVLSSMVPSSALAPRFCKYCIGFMYSSRFSQDDDNEESVNSSDSFTICINTTSCRPPWEWEGGLKVSHFHLSCWITPKQCGTSGTSTAPDQISEEPWNFRSMELCHFFSLKPSNRQKQSGKIKALQILHPRCREKVAKGGQPCSLPAPSLFYWRREFKWKDQVYK